MEASHPAVFEPGLLLMEDFQTSLAWHTRSEASQAVLAQQGRKTSVDGATIGGRAARRSHPNCVLDLLLQSRFISPCLARSLELQFSLPVDCQLTASYSSYSGASERSQFAPPLSRR